MLAPLFFFWLAFFSRAILQKILLDIAGQRQRSVKLLYPPKFLGILGNLGRRDKGKVQQATQAGLLDELRPHRYDYGVAWEIIVPGGEEPKKLENFLKKRFPIGYVRKIFRKKAARVNGARSGPEHTIRPGDRIELFVPFEDKVKREKTQNRPPSAFEVVFENESFLVVHKPAGIAVHEGKEIFKRHSLLGHLEAAYRMKGVHPRLVHRLDKETSGLLLIAKNEETASRLERSLEEGEVKKEYLLLVVGRLYPLEGRIEFPLPGRSGEPVSALTLYKVEKEFAEATLIRARIKTGRMHQLRLHFAKLGHPVVMDKLHGDFAFNRRFRKAHGLKRQFLHACGLGLEYEKKKFRWNAPLPEDLAKTLQSLEAR